MAVAIGAGAVAACPWGLAPAGADSVDDVSWGPVHTLYQHPMYQESFVTTDSGAVVAAWSTTYPSEDLVISVRCGPQGWTKPSVVMPGGAGAFSMIRSGDSAWAIGQSATVASVVQIDGAGHIDKPRVVGPSSAAFIADPVIGMGPTGAGAAVWNQTTRPKDALMAYRTSAGEWEQAERMPVESAYLQGVAVDAAGTATVVFRSKGEGGGRRGFYAIERHADGTWSAPELIGSQAVRGSMAANAAGDLVVAYNVGDSESAEAYLRYRPAGGDFGPRLHLPEQATSYTYTYLSVADDGTAAATYEPGGAGSSPVELIRTDSHGVWSAPEALAVPTVGAIASNGAGDLLIDDGGALFVRCPSGGSCGALESDPANPRATTIYTVGPESAIMAFWFSGCKGFECDPDLLQAHRGH